MSRCTLISMVLVIVGGFAGGCGSSDSGGPDGPEPAVIRGPAGTVKICQLTGEIDAQTDAPTINETMTRAGIYGTDLGASFEHEDELYFLFGDSVGLSMSDEDAIAWSTDNDPDDCVTLDFPTDAQRKWIPPVVPGVSLGAFEVPMEGVSANGAMYVYFTTDHSAAHTMGRSVLARSEDDGLSFELVTDFSTQGKLINVAAEIVDAAAWPGLPEATGQGLLLWGSGEYRESNVVLAFQPLDRIEEPASLRFYTGLTDGAPTWSSQESEATDLFDEPCVGELSVLRVPALGRWLMTYNCGDPRGIRFRTAEQPWGPWSASQNLFHPWDDGGYCEFMHVSHEQERCDEVHDPGRVNEWGGEYGPYLIGRYTHVVPGGAAVYFVMSTWNPYNVMLMRSELLLRGAE